MNDLQKLMLHLSNLQKSGHKEFNVNVEWLLSVLNNLPKDKQEQVSKELELDGGKFEDF